MKKLPTADMATVDYNSMGQDILPPAYNQPMSNSQKLTRIISYTVIALTVIIGIFSLMGIYIYMQRQVCNCPVTDQFSRRMDKLGSIESNDGLSGMASEIVPKKIALPLKLQLDDTAGKMLDRNQKAQVNCIIEKRKATQVISQEPKTVMTPFGNVTSDPGMVHLTGEKMIFSCFSGIKRNKPNRPFKKAVFPSDEKSRPRRGAENNCACDCAC